MGNAVLPGFHRADEIPATHIGVAGGLQRLLLTEVEPRRIVAVAGAVQFLNDRIGQREVILPRGFEVGVQRAAVGAGDRCHIVKRLGAPLDLQRVDARLADQIKKRRGTQVVGVQDITAVLAFADLHILTGAMLLDKVVLPAAGLGALAAVAAAPGHIAGKQAPPGHAHTHSAVDKGFEVQLLGAVIADEGDLGQGQLSCQHHALGAQLIRHGRRLVVGDARLGGNMAFHLRGVLFGKAQNAQVGNDKGIHARLGGGLDILGQLLEFAVGGQGVQRQVDLFAAGVGKNTALAQLVHRQVDGRGAHTELRQGAVDGIRAVQHRVF